MVMAMMVMLLKEQLKQVVATIDANSFAVKADIQYNVAIVNDIRTVFRMPRPPAEASAQPGGDPAESPQSTTTAEGAAGQTLAEDSAGGNAETTSATPQSATTAETGQTVPYDPAAEATPATPQSTTAAEETMQVAPQAMQDDETPDDGFGNNDDQDGEYTPVLPEDDGVFLRSEDNDGIVTLAKMTILARQHRRYCCRRCRGRQPKLH